MNLRKMNFNQIKQVMKRKPSAHKGQSGHVLLIGGSDDYVGALVLAGIAALRAGCDLVTVAAPEKVAWAVNCYSPDLMTKKLKGRFLEQKHIKILMPLLKKCNVLALGNGLGRDRKTKKFCKTVMKIALKKLKVVDADAIKLLSLRDIDNAIITPHAYELKILLENSHLNRITKLKNKKNQSQQLQKHVRNNILLLKGPTDILVSKKKIKFIKGGNPGMAKGGTGDVLAGLCAGFLAQSNGLFKSAEAASTINKKLGGLLLRKKRGYSFIASDMLNEIKRLKNK